MMIYEWFAYIFVHTPTSKVQCMTLGDCVPLIHGISLISLLRNGYKKKQMIDTDILKWY